MQLISDFGSYALVAALLAGWWAWTNSAALTQWLRSAAPSPAPVVAPTGASEAASEEEWVRTLLRLKADMEAAGKDDIAALTRELLWRLMGGDAHPAAAKKG